MQEEYITVEDAAKQIGMHPDSIRRYIREKQLKAYRFRGAYRIKRSDFEKFIEDHATLEDEEKR